MAKQIIVIGGGTGGYVAAIRASQLGAKVTLIEKGALGGTCVNRGCIPTKALVRATEIIQDIKEASIYGIKVDGFAIDYAAVASRREAVVKRLRAGVVSLLKKNKIEVIEGKVSLIDSNTVSVSGKSDKLSADNIIIATGSNVAKIPIDGADLPGVITSDEALAMERPSKNLVVIGGGVIGLEFAQIWRRLGSEVTVVEMMSQILPAEDVEIAAIMAKLFREEGINVFTNASVNGIRCDEEKRKVVSFTQDNKNKDVVADTVLIAAGRSPYTEGLGIEQLNISTNKKAIVVNEQMQTSVPGIYAVGDVVGGLMLAHVAMAEGRCAAENIMGVDSKMNYAAIPRCVYTQPEEASVGLTEAEAKNKHGEVKVGRFPLIGNGRAITITNKPVGLIKIIAEPLYGRIIGVHILGPSATELIAEASLAIQLEATYWDLIATVHAHPTLSEIINEGAMAAAGRAMHL